MKYAIVSVSKTGARLGAKVKAGISGDGTLYERAGSESGQVAVYFKRTMDLITEIFALYDGIIFIMASGIAVRAIASHVVSKASDPAVLVMDECGIHCISLLSGHLGGANAWAREVAAATGAEAVITTATDVHDHKAPDDISRELMMRVEPLQALKPVNSLIAEGKVFAWFLNSEIPDADIIRNKLDKLGIECLDINLLSKADYAGCAVISEKSFNISKPHVYLRPKNLYIGIGCKRGTPEKNIYDAFQDCLKKIGACEYQVVSLASVDLKADEKGLLDFARHMNLPIHFYRPEELKIITDEYQLEKSSFVEKTIGVGNVCQSAALMESAKGRTILPKTKYVGVTVAAAMGLSTLSE